MSTGGDSPSAGGEGCSIGGGEIMLFGVKLKVDTMRKCVSMNNLSEYQPVTNNGDPMEEKSGNESNSLEREVDVNGVVCYVSADDALPPPSKRCRDRKRGIPWTEEEHKKFLIGLQKVGRGDWRGISKNYVNTRTPTQVASHAQKYFIRQSNLSHRRRSSLFDITTDLLTEVRSEVRQGGLSPPQPVMLQASSQLPLPVTAQLPREDWNHPKNPVMFLSPILTHHPTSSIPLGVGTKEQMGFDPSSLSMSLSLSMGEGGSFVTIKH